MTRKAAEWLRPLVAGKTVACLASGPSLTREDVEAVREAGWPTIVTNTTFRLAPWAAVLMGYDPKWWQTHRREVDEVFRGWRVTPSAAGRACGAESLAAVLPFRPFGNSGTAAISLAALGGARRIVLLGYDSQLGPHGERHWHGDHPPELSNARSLKTWPGKFAQVATYARRHGCAVVNASRATALTCFPRVDLDDELGNSADGAAIGDDPRGTPATKEPPNAAANA